MVSELLVRLLADGKFHSGSELGSKLSCSRAAVWKQVVRLRSLGLQVQAVTGRGYRLLRPLELLDASAIQNGVPQKFRGLLEVLFVVDSTNRYLLKEAHSGAVTGRMCVSEYQKDGRGRRGRQWVAPFGASVCMSILWRSQQGAGRLAGLSLVAGVAVRKALTSLGVGDVTIKWPNDLWLAKRKVGGILIEVAGESNGPCFAVIGIGLNVALPEDTMIDQPWVSLESTHPGLSRNLLVSTVASETLSALESFEIRGLTPFLEEWEMYDALKDQEVVVRLDHGDIRGRAVGIDKTGALKLWTDQGMRTFASGEVSLRAVD